MGPKKQFVSCDGGLKELVGMVGIQRLINISQIHIHKPKLHPFVGNYTSFKFKAYYM
jgi:hypothetical protein